jgi:hypothetical protein
LQITAQTKANKVFQTSYEPNKQTSGLMVNKYQPTLRRLYSHSYVMLLSLNFMTSDQYYFLPCKRPIFMSVITLLEVNVPLIYYITRNSAICTYSMSEYRKGSVIQEVMMRRLFNHVQYFLFYSWLNSQIVIKITERRVVGWLW